MSNDPASRQVVLFVDDSRDELSLLVEAAEQADFTALAATSGDAALILLDRVTPHLVVMDAMMPGLDGFEACRRIKGDPRFAHLPVIFMTGLKDTADVVRGFEAGGVDYVTKPVHVVELMARIRVHLANAQVAFGARVALDATGRYLLAADRAGKARWCTPQAASLLSSAFDGLEGPDIVLPAHLSAQLQELIASREVDRVATVTGRVQSEITVSFLGPSGPDEFLFRFAKASLSMEEDLLRRELALTLREAEVLLWIARGKSNKEVSEILLISPRTVNKHLERVFAKLGVENRASAASVAMRILAARL